MKTLVDLVREEMANKNMGGHPVEPNVNGIIDPAVMQKIMDEAFVRQQKAQARIDQDPAIALLVAQAVQVIQILQVMPAPPQAKQQALGQFFIELIEIWEIANTRFDDQLKPKP